MKRIYCISCDKWFNPDSTCPKCGSPSDEDKKTEQAAKDVLIDFEDDWNK